MAKAIPARADGQVRRVAGRFALVALAGELAREFAVLPWPEGEASRAALVCFKAWLERRGHIGASERERGLQAVVDFVSQHGISRFAPWDETDAKTPNMAGVRKISLGKELTSKFGKSKEREGWDFYFTSTGWKEACKGFDSNAVARDAMEEGLLKPGPGGKPYRKERTPYGQARYYVIRGKALGSFRSEDVA
jgi:putative DNA primase/helicase